jgi:LuxR family maltose regulon positive regulatory protein
MRLQRGLAAAYAAVARRDWNRALELLAAGGTLADQLRRGREGIRIKLLRALALRATGGDSTALLHEAMSLADTYGLRRMLIDTHPELTDADGAAPPDHRPGATPNKDQRGVLKNDGPRVTSSALLTPKEGQVLRLLARRLSNKQIAAALDVGDATVKWHLKNVFMKLNVGTREHALHRARMLGILETV